MRSWTPRRPSPALEARLFGAARSPSTTAGDPPRRWPGWGWLAPVACVFVLALQLGTPKDGKPLAGGEVRGPALALLNPSNRMVTAFVPAWANSAMNNVNGETFESTNWTTAPSPMRTLPVFLTLTNGLIQ